MELDNEAQRKFLLDIFASMSFPGAAVEMVYETKQAIKLAKLAKGDGRFALAVARESSHELADSKA